jgi:hypothetical protein
MMAFNSVHKRQLFHWFGKDIEQNHKLSVDEKIALYLKYLAFSLKHGLRLTWQSEPLCQPGLVAAGYMVCFTDNKLSDCIYHSQRFGKMGLGFSKKYVLGHQGKPVIYIRNNRLDWFARTLHDLSNGVSRTNDEKLIAQLRYITAFLKPMSKSAPLRKSRKAKKTTHPMPTYPTNPAYARHYGPKLDYYVEHEWRIVLTDSMAQKLAKDTRDDLYRLPYRVGTELFTVVFPDLRTQSAALQDRVIKKLLVNHTPPINYYHLQEIAEL